MWPAPSANKAKNVNCVRPLPSKSVDRVQLREKMSSIFGKVFCRQPLQIILRRQIGEQLGCLGFDMVWETERAPLLRDTYCSRSARPIENILEQMMMDRAEMRKIQFALGKRFVRPRMRNLGFEIVELALIVQIKLVN